jgi:threonine aldolase
VRDGKIRAEQIARCVAAHYADSTAEHMVQPGMVYLSQPSEVGNVYSLRNSRDPAGLRSIRYAVYIDGARLATRLPQRARTCFCRARALSSAFSIGGTKMGALLARRMVITIPAEEGLRYT